MTALINETRKHNLELLEEIIVNCIEQNQKLCVQVETVDLCVRNVIQIDNYELDENHLYIYYENFETHLNLDDSIELVCSETTKSFFIKKGNVKVNFDVIPSNLH